jgi:hypothetical protein
MPNTQMNLGDEEEDEEPRRAIEVDVGLSPVGIISKDHMGEESRHRLPIVRPSEVNVERPERDDSRPVETTPRRFTRRGIRILGPVQTGSPIRLPRAVTQGPGAEESEDDQEEGVSEREESRHSRPTPPAPLPAISFDSDSELWERALRLRVQPILPQEIQIPVATTQGQGRTELLSNLRDPLARAAQGFERQRFADHTGEYDDDDAVVQAALRVLLKDRSWGGVTIPTEVAVLSRIQITSDSRTREEKERSRTMNKALAHPIPNANEEDDQYVGAEEEGEKVDKGKGNEKEIEPTLEPVDVDEMRRRRLARFGGGG